MLRSGLKSQLQGVLAKEGIVAHRTSSGDPRAGASSTSSTGDDYRKRVDSIRSLIASYDREILALGGEIDTWLAGDVGYVPSRPSRESVPSSGRSSSPRSASHALRRPDRLCSWAGLTPRHRESDNKVTRSGITKQGSRLVRWAAIEAISRGRDTSVDAHYRRVKERRGTNVAQAAAARKLLHLVYYGMRDGEIRCLDQAG